MEPKDVLTILPPKLAIPLAIAYLVAPLVPKEWLGALGRSRAYEREKQQLQLLKMRYEVEALRKEKGLEDLSHDAWMGDREPGAAPAQAPSSRWVRFLLGMAGGLLLPIANIALQGGLLLHGGDWMAGVIAGIVVVASIGGFAAMVLGQRATPRWGCVLLGITGSLLILSLANALLHIGGSSVPPNASVGFVRPVT